MNTSTFTRHIGPADMDNHDFVSTVQPTLYDWPGNMDSQNSSDSAAAASHVPSPTVTTSFPINNTDDILQRLSDERAMQILPVLIIFGVIFVLGVLGNSLTIYIYFNKFKATWSRTAIVTLGILDLISCLVAIPGEVVDLRFSFNYESDVMCRISRACATFPNVASGIMLTTVAFDRYRLICLPLKSSATRRHAWKHVLMVLTMSLIVTWPAAIVYGTKAKETGISHVTGSECSFSDLVKDTKYPLIYNAVLACVFLFAFTAMIVFYFCIGRQIYRQGEFRKMLLNMRDRRRNTHSDLETSMVSDPDGGGDLSHGNSSENPHQSASEKSKESTEMKKKGHSDSQPASPSCPVSPPCPGSSQRPKLSHQRSIIQRIRKKSSVDSRTRKTTMMLFLISIVFVLSFLPHLAIKLVKILDKDFLKEASTQRFIYYNLAARSYFLNSFVNVFIYGFCSFRFRREAKKALRKVLLWKACSRQYI
ncbi:hypothetical protein ACOMHN_032867 [Nucella lapillus]